MTKPVVLVLIIATLIAGWWLQRADSEGAEVAADHVSTGHLAVPAESVSASMVATAVMAPAVSAKPLRLSQCILRAGVDATEREAFLRRYRYLGLTERELAKIVAAMRDDGLSEALLADYDAEVSASGHHSFELKHPSEAAATDAAPSVAERVANQALSASYRATTPDHYQFSQSAFDQALDRFVEVYQHRPTDAAILLYLHMRAAQQQYWRYAQQADWRQWVYFEHHRQALVFAIEQYGSPEQVARIRQDRHLISTVNRYSGELDRGFGPVLAAPVYQKIAFYKQRFGFDAAAANAEPKNFSDSSQAVSFQQQEPGALDRLQSELWPRGTGRALTDLFTALAKDCQQ